MNAVHQSEHKVSYASLHCYSANCAITTVPAEYEGAIVLPSCPKHREHACEQFVVVIML